MTGQALPENLTFEQALKRLEEIVADLESGNVPLDKAIQFYEEGTKLKVFCEEKLKTAKMKVDQVNIPKDPEASPSLSPFSGA